MRELRDHKIGNGMEPRIESLTEKKLVGKSLTMSLAQNRTAELWGGFMSRRKAIPHTVDARLYSLQVYDLHHFQNFDPSREFRKWAAVEVSSFDALPPDMESFVLCGGLYAVFLYKGPSTDARIFQFIYTDWLPRSPYTLDHRPHFELLGEKYKTGDPDSEEEIWIPVSAKE